MTANGLASRRLRSRSRPTAKLEVASHARWNPPIPLTATMRPARRLRAATRKGSSPSNQTPSGDIARTLGPQTGQALGWAWNRRSSTRSYSLRHRGHIPNSAMVVAARS